MKKISLVLSTDSRKHNVMTIGKYSFGIGDRFAYEGVNQLKALIEAEKQFGVHFVPVWNKSNREHQIVGTEP